MRREGDVEALPSGPSLPLSSSPPLLSFFNRPFLRKLPGPLRRLIRMWARVEICAMRLESSLVHR
jgi:hypothetical protein